MSYAPLINLDEFFGMPDIGPDQFHQSINVNDDFLSEDFPDFETIGYEEDLDNQNCLGFHNYNNNGEFLNYIYGDRRDSHNKKFDANTVKDLIGYNSPNWRKECTSTDNIDTLERFRAFNDLIGIDNQIEQNECNKAFEFVSNMTFNTDNIESDKDFVKQGPQTLKFDYDNIKINQNVVQCKLVNFAANSISESTLILILSRLNRRKESEEERIFSVNRTRYTRANIESLSILHPNVQYQRNAQFSIAKPYEPEYIRVQINPLTNAPFNETRCGLCPYCPSLIFKNLKTSTYAQHLSLTHGIQTDNYITPNPLLYGSYNLKKNNTNRKTRAHISEKNGVICPVCHDIVETECSKTTATQKPLNNYLRHFKEKHRKCKEKEDPVKFFSKTSTNELKLLLV